MSMQSVLSALRAHVEVLHTAGDGGSSRRPRGGKLERAKALTAITEAVSKRSVFSALTYASERELCLGPTPVDSPVVPLLGWTELMVEVLDALACACKDALAAKPTKSATSPLRPEYVACFRAVLKQSIAHGPPGALRSIIPAFLAFAYQWLSEPVLRAVLADQLWQCVRDLLHADENRAMLSSGYLRTWVDVCFEQLTAHGPLHVDSSIATGLAREVFITLGRSVDTFDTLTQTTKGMHGSKMLGGDFGYALILERCCLMLALSVSRSIRDTRALQSSAMLCMAVVLTDHAVDVVGSKALDAVIDVSLSPIVACWADRRHQDAALALSRVLIQLAPDHETLRRALRIRVKTDIVGDIGAMSSVRTYGEARPDFIDIAAVVFPLEEAMGYVRSHEKSADHATVWLHIAYTILSRRVLQVETAGVVKPAHVLRQCTLTAETVSNLLQKADRTRSKSVPVELILCCCRVVDEAVGIARRIRGQSCDGEFQAPGSAWYDVYRSLLHRLVQARYSVLSRSANPTAANSTNLAEQAILRSLSNLISSDMVDGALISAAVSNHADSTTLAGSFWETPAIRGSPCPTVMGMRFTRNHVARSGFHDDDGGHLRLRLSLTLISVCEPKASQLRDSQAIVHAASAVLGLARGACVVAPLLSHSDATLSPCPGKVNPNQSLNSFMSLFGSGTAQQATDVPARSLVIGTLGHKKVWLNTDERILFPGGGGWCPTFFGRQGEDMTATSCDTDSFLAVEARHFMVDGAQVRRIERQVLAKLSALAVSVDKEEPSSSIEGEDHEIEADLSGSEASLFEDQVPSRSLGSVRGVGSAARIILFVANYLCEGLRVGVISVSDVPQMATAAPGGGEHAVEELCAVLGRLLLRVSVTPASILVQASDLISPAVESCCRLHNVLRAVKLVVGAGTNQSSSGGNNAMFWDQLELVLSEVLTKIVSVVCKQMCAALVERTVGNVASVRNMASHRFQSQALRGRKRPRRNSPPQRRRRVTKRARRPVPSFSDDSYEDSDDSKADDSDGWPVEKNVAPQRAKSRARSRLDSDSSDSNHGNFVSPPRQATEGTSSNDPLANARVLGDSCDTVSRAAEILRSATKVIAALGEVVLEGCIKGLRDAVTAESRLAPDGYERSAVVSAVVDPSYIGMRSQVWEVLCSLGSPTAFETAALDVHHIGSKWEGLEAVASKHVQFYVAALDVGIRKNYPAPDHLEQLRVTFLLFAARYLESCVGIGFRGDERPRSAPSPLRLRLVTSIVAVAELFRVRDAFRMPRGTRLLFLSYSTAAVELLLGPASLSVMGKSSETSSRSTLIANVHSLQKVIGYLLSDAEAVVRMAAAGAVPMLFRAQTLRNTASAEETIMDALPRSDLCTDQGPDFASSVDVMEYKDCEQDARAVRAQWELAVEDEQIAIRLHRTFRHIGAASKAAAAVVALGEVSASRADLMPACIFELMDRVRRGAASFEIAHRILIRICARCGYGSPDKMFAIHARCILQKWFAGPDAEQSIYDFPASLVLEEDRAREGAVFDWMSYYQGELLPFLLLAEDCDSGLNHCAAFATSIGTDLVGLLEANVASFSRVYPMMFTGGLDHSGHKLWTAISDIFDNAQAITDLQRAAKAEILRSLLLSVSSGTRDMFAFNGSDSGKSGALGFFRDARGVQPPMYDALVVAVAMERLFSEDGDAKSTVVSRSSMQGSLFCKPRGVEAALEFPGLTLDARKNGIIMTRLLLSIWRTFEGPPGPPPPQTRVDAFFSLGLLWRIHGANMLGGPSNDRRLFYKIIATGFRFEETAKDALWLLLDVAQKTNKFKDDGDSDSENAYDQVSFADLSMVPNETQHLVCLSSSQERRWYELLSSMTPTLVSIGGNEIDGLQTSEFIRSLSCQGLTRLLRRASDAGMSSAIVALDPFPSQKQFKEVRQLQTKAALDPSLLLPTSGLQCILDEMHRFVGTGSHTKNMRCSLLTLARLCRLRAALSNDGAHQLANMVDDEGWMRSNGLNATALSILNKVLSSLVDIACEATATTKNLPSSLPATQSASSWISTTGLNAYFGPLDRQSPSRWKAATASPASCGNGASPAVLLHEASRLIGVLGSIHPVSVVLEGNAAGARRLPSYQACGKFEESEIGTGQALIRIRDALFGDSAVVADTALDTAISVLASREMKKVYSALTKSVLGPLAHLRSYARKLPQTSNNLVLRDPTFGQEVLAESLPHISDAKLWTVKRGDEENWARQLCAVLTRQCKSDALRRLSAMCYVSTAFANDMLPYLLMDIVSAGRQDVIAQISHRIKTTIMDNSSTPVFAMRVIVHSLDAICQLRLRETSTHGVGDLFKGSRKRDSLLHMYILDIPYLTVARTANKCGGYLSAIRYASLHIDHESIRAERELLNSSRATSSTGRGRRQSGMAATPRETSILLAERKARIEAEGYIISALENVNEPDGRRGLGQQGDLMQTCAHMATMEEDWARSLGTLDALSAPLLESSEDAMRDGSTLSAKLSDKNRKVCLSREFGLMQSLMGLGSAHLVVDHWYGLRQRIARYGIAEMKLSDGHEVGADSITKLNELRFAAAWKLGEWESPMVVTAPPDRSGVSNVPLVGLHQALHQTLGSLCRGNVEGALGAIANARSAQAKWLCRAYSGESARRVYQVATRFHVLNHIEDISTAVANTVVHQAQNTSSARLSSSVHESFSAPRGGDQITGRAAGLARPGLGSGTLATRFFDLAPTAAPVGMSAQEHQICGDREAWRDRIARKFFDSESFSIEVTTARIPADDGFEVSDLLVDFPLAIARSIGLRGCLARVAADVSSTLFSRGGCGAWSRAAACLGSPGSVAISEATELDIAQWRLQEARLRWASSRDGNSRQRALSQVKEVITNQLRGEMKVLRSKSKSSKGYDSYSFTWEQIDASEARAAWVRANACHTAASWSADMRTDEPMELFRSYMEMGLDAVKDVNAIHLRGYALYAMAAFADKQISNIDNYRKTKKYDQMVAAVQEAERKIASLEKMRVRREGGSSGGRQLGGGLRASRSQLASAAITQQQIRKDLSALIKEQKKKATLDRQRLERLNEHYREWQLLACQHYACSLKDGSTNDMRAAFRLVALWLDAESMRERITETVSQRHSSGKRVALGVPCSKLLRLAPQLASRLGAPSATDAKFQTALSGTLEAMAESHPAHCLWQLLSLSNATRVTANNEKYASLYRGDKDKKDAADRILENLRSQHGRSVEQMKTVAEGYILLSELDDARKVQNSSLSIANEMLCSLGELEHVVIPTVPLPLSGSSSLNASLPHVVRFEPKAGVCSGLSRPLRVTCVGSDGVFYPQIVKGRDDLRGDAVMEQMFSILNDLLRSDPEAAGRELLVRTYRVVPLSPFSGIMQFVKDTSELKKVLVDDARRTATQPRRASLHQRYRPHDIGHNEIQRMVFDLRSPQDTQQRVVVLAGVWEKFRPVFRYFFLEQWPDPADWYTHQLAYSRSVAVMSIVGFILGLGDRHLSNILVDVSTGEVVHIDFGIAFEQGKLLQTPELMPFRLTRDLVDGFGISGVDGVYRRCCEVTLDVMRKNKDVLLTVIEVLLHDPMFNWALTPEDVLREQMDNKDDQMIALDSEDEDDVVEPSLADSDVDAVARKVREGVQGSREAQRARNRIAEKLDGLEDTERLSVEAHVARLIDEATSFHVIACAYPGWCPWV